MKRSRAVAILCLSLVAPVARARADSPPAIVAPPAPQPRGTAIRMRNNGIALMVVGAMHFTMALGIGILCLKNAAQGFGCDGPSGGMFGLAEALGGAGLAGGVLFTSIGVPLFVIGSRRAAAPQATVGLSGPTTLQVRF
jgi:hypothetical protein